MEEEKIIVIPDIHGRVYWHDIIEAESKEGTIGKVVFLGDYWDSFDVSFAKQLDNFRNIMAFKEANKEKVVLLLGNHDYHYCKGIHETYSGFQNSHCFLISGELEKYKKYFKIGHIEGKYLFTHAGVSSTFLKQCSYEEGPIDDFLNELWEYRPMSFKFDGWDQYGDDIEQGPLWIRPVSLVRDSDIVKAAGLIQIVGHTQVKNIGKDPEGHFYFVDTFGTSKEYLVIKGDEVTIKNIDDGNV